jgi:signal transduction histidine kinase
VEHNVTFICQDNEDGIQIEGDRHRLMQVLTNLMSNAAKFSRAGGRIEMSTMRDNDTVRVAVRDFGVGIPEEFQEHLFDKFTQADSSDTRQKGGTGLGLSISKAIIEKHNGAITFETETGVGSTFTVELPVLVQSDLAPAENLRG